MNASWHARNPMPPKATLAQRVAWHLRHAKACGCREIAKSVAAELRRQGRPVPASRKADMKKNYDSSKARRNPYASRLKRKGAPARPAPRRPQ
jgi:NAD(P)H-flavin reductase